MEIVKQNCTFSISDTTSNGWKMSGNYSLETQGALSINYSVVNELEENIGDCNYYKPTDGRISVNYSVLEANKAEFSTYMDSVVEQIINHIGE